MENKNVTTFVSIVEYGSFTKAADHLGYSQAAVTAQIKAIEAELGVPLFDRINKKVYLTQAGKAFLPYALNMLKAEEEAVCSVKHNESLSGELRISAPSSYAMYNLPDLLLKFSSLYPDVSISLSVSDFPEESISKLSRSEMDFLVILDESRSFPGLQITSSKREELVFVTWPGNPILRNAILQLDDIVKDDFIVVSRNISYSELLERHLEKSGIPFRPRMDVGSVGAVVNMLLGGFGTSFLPEFIVRDHIKKGELVALNIQEKLTFDLYASYVCSKNRWINPIMKEFIRIVQADHAAGI